jgi:hypothetical protein
VRPVPLAPATERARWLRCAVLGLVGSITLLLSIVLFMGVFYIWFMTGFSPTFQVRERGFRMVLAWLFGGLFAAFQLAAAFVLERNGPWGIAGITLCLLILWMLGLRRRRILRHPAVNRHEDHRSRGAAER